MKFRFKSGFILKFKFIKLTKNKIHYGTEAFLKDNKQI